LLKAERARDAKRADAASAPLAGVGVGAILDQGDAAAPGDFEESIQVGGMPAQVDRDDGPGAGSDGGFDQERIDALGVFRDVDHHRHGAGEEDGAGGGDEGAVGDDDFVAGADAQRGDHNFQGMGAIGDGDAMPGPVEGGEMPLEFQRLGAGSAPPDAAVQDIEQRLPLPLVELRPDGKGFGFDGLSAQESELRHCCEAP
jgi:hypothetical protein